MGTGTSFWKLILGTGFQDWKRRLDLGPDSGTGFIRGPDSETRFGDRIRGPDSGTRFGERFGDQIRGPDSGTRFGDWIWGLVLRSGTSFCGFQEWMVTGFGDWIRGPDSGTGFGDQIWGLDLGTGFWEWILESGFRNDGSGFWGRVLVFGKSPSGTPRRGRVPRIFHMYPRLC